MSKSIYMEATKNNQEQRTCLEKTMQDSTTGFSLIEIIIVVSILIVLTVLGFNAASNFGKADAVKNSARTLATILDEARARTLASENRSQYGVHIVVGESKVTFFEGTAYSSSDPDNRIFSFDPRVAISTTTRGSVTDVIFTRLSGTSTSITVTIAHTKDASTTESVLVQTTGLVIMN